MALKSNLILTEDQFQEIVKHRLDMIRELLLVKGQEYTRNGDRLHNFRRAAIRKEKHMLEIVDDYNTKHIMSFYDMIDDVKAGKRISQKTLDDKITDILDYFLLGEAVIVEHNQKLDLKVRADYPLSAKELLDR